MLNILKKKQNIIKGTSLNIHSIDKENSTVQVKLNKNEYKNIIYYPSSSKE